MSCPAQRVESSGLLQEAAGPHVDPDRDPVQVLALGEEVHELRDQRRRDVIDEKWPRSSSARSAVLRPAPESPVTATSCNAAIL